MSHLVHKLRETINKWRYRHPLAVIAVWALLAPLILIISMQWAFGIWETAGEVLQAFRKISNRNDANYIRAYGSLVSAFGLLIGGPLGVFGFILAVWRTLNNHRDTTLAARKFDGEFYTKAVEQLGNDKMSVRMGATLAIEELGQASAKFRPIIVKILCAHIRASRSNAVISKLDEVKEEVSIPTDIQMGLDAVFRLLKIGNEPMILDLSHTNLAKAKLKDANLSQADLTGAILNGADLTGADLSRADLTGADLTGANLSQAKAHHAILANATLKEAILDHCMLRYANLKDVVGREVLYNESADIRDTIHD